MKKSNVNTKEWIYDLMNGTIDLDKFPLEKVSEIENEFALDKPCGIAYEHIFDANANLCQRLDQNEDADVEAIISNYSLITRHLCMKMYDYGFNHALEDGNIVKIISFYQDLSDRKKKDFINLLDSLKKIIDINKSM